MNKTFFSVYILKLLPNSYMRILLVGFLFPQEWQALGIEQIRLETRDIVAAPSQEQLKRGVNFILKYKQQGDCVYVHCKAGRSRSATLVACYLMQVCIIFCIIYLKEKSYGNLFVIYNNNNNNNIHNLYSTLYNL